MIYYSDPKKQEKLEEAIKLGFIFRRKDKDGIFMYALTQRGLNQWLFEKSFRR